MKRRIDNEPNKIHIIIDIGAKLQANIRLFNQAYAEVDSRVVYIPVRPNDSDADHIYNSVISNYILDGHFFATPVINQYIQDFRLERTLDILEISLDSIRIHYLMIDVHYYLADWQPLLDAI